MVEKVTGIVIRETNVAEADKILTVLTNEKGKISIRAQNIRRSKSVALAGARFLCYSDFVIAKANDIYFLRQCSPIETFYNISEDIVKLSLATYLGQLTAETVPEGVVNKEVISLLLNTFYVLSNKNYKTEFIKMVFELRLMGEQGYMPSILVCEKCGEKNFPMRFNVALGQIYCNCCERQGVLIDESVLSAMQYVFFCNSKKIFSFEVTDEVLRVLSNLSEQYVLTHIDKKLKSLEYLKMFL